MPQHFMKLLHGRFLVGKQVKERCAHIEARRKPARGHKREHEQSEDEPSALVDSAAEGGQGALDRPIGRVVVVAHEAVPSVGRAR